MGRHVTDEALAKALSSEAQAGQLINDMLAGLPTQQPPAQKSRRHLAPLIPAGHGIAVVATFMLAVTSAISALRARFVPRVRAAAMAVDGESVAAAGGGC